MKEDDINQRITAAGLTTLIKVGVVGLLAAEVGRLGWLIARPLNVYINAGNHESDAFLIVAILVVLGVAYVYLRDCEAQLGELVRSERLDLLAAVVVGAGVSFAFNGIGTKWYLLALAHLTLLELFVLISIPPILGLLLVLRAFRARYVSFSEKHTPFFISDQEGTRKAQDLLGFADNAERFAERVLNNDSRESVVFGVDGPWGIGKSTFVNYCIETWEEEKYIDKVAVYKFSPLQYEDRENLLDKFVDGLVATIQKGSFVPEIQPLVSKYSRLIKPKSTFSLFGLEIELPLGTRSVDDAFVELEAALKDSSKKIVVVVDDLDRLTFSAITDVLYAIKKSFTLPNVSYVLCYDTENVGVFNEKNADAEKVREFLEKFVNVKITVFVDSKNLENFISDSSKAVLGVDEWVYQSNTQLALRGLREILQSPEYYNYVPFIGDLRKIKRYINILKLFELEKIDHVNSDLNAQDLAHLLLIYINYPNIFRKIYNAETSNRRGFFSLVIKYDPNYPPEDEASQQGRSRGKDNLFKNSTLYTSYLKDGNLTKEQKFLLEKVFTVSKRLESAEIDSVPADIKSTYACFNGGSPWSGGSNLEVYLNIIAKLEKPEKRGQYRFYLNAANEIKDGTPIEDVMSEAEFSVSESENSHQQLWKVIAETAHDLSPAIGSAVITYLLDHSPDYSFFTNEKVGVGFRDDLDYLLVKLLDTVGWSDPNGKHRNNTEEHIAEIAEWVFGEGRHVDHGVIQTLSQRARGVLGLYDTLAFRLFCSADRGGDIFNLQRALSLHGSSTAPTQGAVHDIAVEEMRELSQLVFSIFKEQYITPGRNLFSSIEALSLRELTGEWFGYLEAQVASGKLTQADVDSAVISLKSRMKSFIVYQLTNNMVSSGVGCGFYDETGKKDENGISIAMNEYLFTHCFNPAIDQQNYEHLMDYLLGNFASVFGIDPGLQYVPNFGEFTKVLDRTRLADYWRTNRTTIRALNLETKEKTIINGNYEATYTEDLLPTYAELDKLVAEIDTPVPVETVAAIQQNND